MALGAGDIVFGAALGFLSGVFAAAMGWNIPFVLAAAAACAAVLLFLIKKLFLWKDFLLFMGFIFFGAFYFHWHAAAVAVKTNIPYNRFSVFSALVTDEPQPSQKFLILTAEAQPPFAGTVTILAPPTGDEAYGDLLQVSGVVMPPDATGGNALVLARKVAVRSRRRGFWLRQELIDLKNAILKNFDAVLPADQAALLGGITFGSKENFDPALKNAMALSSTTHIVAVSGYNITIVILAAEAVCGRFLSRRKTFAVSVGLVILFVLMTGLAPSAIRAAITGSIALFAKAAGRMYDIRNAIAIAAAAMIAWDPSMLLANIGLQLSFISLLGIVYLGPALKKLFRYRGAAGFLEWKECGITTLSAQLAVMPVLIADFGRFSATAIVANILILPTVPLAMFFGFILAALGFISHYLAFFCAQLAGLILFYELAVMRLFAAWAVPVPLVFDTAMAMAAYYAAIAFFIAAAAKGSAADKKSITP